jgi:WD40 repeat protein
VAKTDEKPLDNPEITDMELLWEEYDGNEIIMMICCNAKEYIVYDESDSETSMILRRVYGGHTEEITILAFDWHLQLVATGCINGEICLYDFEMSKVEGFLMGHTGDITAIEFLSPYPLVATASMDSSVCIWGVRPSPEKYLNVCIKRFSNFSWNLSKDVSAVVTRMKVWNYHGKGIKKYRRLK